MNRLYCIVTAILLLNSRALTAQTWQDSIVVLPLNATLPADAAKLGSLKEGNNAVSTDCNYEGMIMAAKEKARAMGGNIVKITRVVEPAFISKCYKITADVYHTDKLPAHNTNTTREAKANNPKCATLYIYRLRDTLALITPYNIHLNDDSVICVAKSRSRDSVNLYKEGATTLWAKTEKRAELKLDVKFGSVYYIRCGLQKGEIRMLPVMQLMDITTGSEEYDHLKKKKRKTNVNYLYQIH